MGVFKKVWTAEAADRWSKEDYFAFVLSPLVYFLLALGVAFSLLLRWYGWLLLGLAILLLVLLIKIIDPKLKAISEDYEIRQKDYLEDLEKIARWEE